VLEPFLEHELPIKFSLDPPVITEVTKGMRDLTTTLHVTLQSDQPMKPFETQLVFQSKTERTYRTTMVPITGQVADAWRFERPALALGVLDVGQEVSKNIKYFWTGDQPPDVEELKSDVPELELSQKLDAERKCFVVTVKCTPTKPGKIEGDVVLKTKQSTEPGVLHVTARVK
jgi:hypothetical protein